MLRQLGYGTVFPLLIALTLLGLAFRAFAITKWPLWGDEALTTLIVQWPLHDLFFRPVDSTSGLYYALHKLLLGADSGVAQSRLISLIAGTMIIPTAYCFARLVRAPALLAAGVTALSFPLIDYSQEARAYGLLVTLITASATFFVWWDKSRRSSALVGFVISTLFCIYTHPIAVFWVVPASVAAYLLANADRSRVALAITALIILAVPEMLRSASYVGFNWLEHASAAQVLATLGYAFLPLGITELEVPLQSSAMAAGVCFAVLLWRGVSWRRSISMWASCNRGAAVALAILILAPIAMWATGIAKPIFMPRTTLLAAPAFLIALSALARAEGKAAEVVLACLFAMALLSTGTVRDKPDWRWAADFLTNNVRPGDAIIVCPHWQAPALRHAIRQPLPVPIIGLIDNRLIVVERTNETNWQTAHRKVLLDHRHSTASIDQVKRVWRVSIVCPQKVR